ncbi:MAG TPA: hypothetical protein VFZ66_27460 [Herpetosiphonaceae bacterium]
MTSKRAASTRPARPAKQRKPTTSSGAESASTRPAAKPEPGISPARSAAPEDTQGFEARTVKTIIRLLERCTVVGRRPAEVFTDWIELVHALLDMEPKHEQALAETGTFAPDPPEVVALLVRLRQTYPYREGAKEHYLDYFLQAFAELRMSTTVGFVDIVGTIYMQWGWPNATLGQFFTPTSLTSLITRLTIGDGRSQVHAQLQAAIAQSPAAQAALLAGSTLEGEVALAWLIARVIPHAIEHYEPVTVYDPCVGSAAFLVSASEQFDPWMNQLLHQPNRV